MSGAVVDPRLHAARGAPKRRMRLSWTDPVFRNLVWQVAVVGVLVAIVAYLVHNTSQNSGCPPHRHRLCLPEPQCGGSRLASTCCRMTPAVSTYGDALIIGILNTLKVAVVGIILTTILAR